jgi:hypothetical protein
VNQTIATLVYFPNIAWSEIGKKKGTQHLGTQFSYPVRAWLFLLPNW